MNLAVLTASNCFIILPYLYIKGTRDAIGMLRIISE
jgi:hypothetical protein